MLGGAVASEMNVREGEKPLILLTVEHVISLLLCLLRSAPFMLLVLSSSLHKTLLNLTESQDETELTCFCLKDSTSSQSASYYDDMKV